MGAGRFGMPTDYDGIRLQMLGVPGGLSKRSDQVWFQVANTRLALEPMASGSKPAIERLSFRIAGFDKKMVAAKLEKLQVQTTPTCDHALPFIAASLTHLLMRWPSSRVVARCPS